MKIEKDGLKSKFKYNHIILLSCILGLIFVLNSNIVKAKKANTKLLKEKGDLVSEAIN